MTTKTTLTRSEVKEVLLNWGSFEWQVQGFGMLRTYFDDVRLQIWDQRLAVWGNNAVHDHPWDFESTIIAGQLFNQRFIESSSGLFGIGSPYFKRVIQPGVGGGVLDDMPSRTWLEPKPVEVYQAGEKYGQRAAELHMTRYSQGTVTILERERVRKDQAVSLWPVNHGVSWVFYEPRPATEDEARTVIRDCLNAWWL